MKIKGKSLFFIIIIVVSILIVVGAVIFSTNGSNSQPPIEQLVKENSQVKGSDDAKVIIVEFGDFQCPACKDVVPVLKKIEDEYKDQVKFVFRHFPLQVNKNAMVASQASEAAGDQGKFWEYHDVLYDQQEVWGESTDPRELFEEYAQQLDLDLDSFKQDLDDDKFTSKINEDIRYGKGVGVGSTPTFFLNGEKMVGVPDFDTLKTKIDQILDQPS